MPNEIWLRDAQTEFVGLFFFCIVLLVSSSLEGIGVVIRIAESDTIYMPEYSKLMSKKRLWSSPARKVAAG